MDNLLWDNILEDNLLQDNLLRDDLLWGNLLWDNLQWDNQTADSWLTGDCSTMSWQDRISPLTLPHSDQIELEQNWLHFKLNIYLPCGTESTSSWHQNLKPVWSKNESRYPCLEIPRSRFTDCILHAKQKGVMHPNPLWLTRHPLQADLNSTTST